MHRHLFRLIPFAACLLATPVLSAQPAEGPPAPTPPATTRPDEPAGPPVVTLLEAGAGPHRALRFRPAVGTTQAIEMTVRVEMERSLGGTAMPSQKAPAMQYTMESTITAADEGGDISYAFEYKTADVLDEPDANPIVVEMMRNALKAIVGLRGKGIITDRGLSKLVRFDRPADMDPMLQQQVGEMERSMEQLVSPFPAEPVGAGAVWQVDSALEQQGMRIKQTVVVTLVAADADRVEVRSELTQTAEPQVLEMPGVPPMNLKSYLARGTTTAVLRLGQLFPHTSTTTLTNDTAVMIDRLGVQQELVQHSQLTSETKTQ